MLLAAILFASPVRADDALKAVPLAQGDIAPFGGQLLSTELALRLGLQAERCDALTKLTLDYERKRAEVQVKLEQDLRGSLERRCRLEQKALRASITATAPAFYERPWFVVLVTSAAWVLVFVGAVGLVS